MPIGKCSDCRHCAYGYMTTLDGQGVFKFAYCEYDIVNLVVVDAGAMKVCEKFAWNLEALEQGGVE